VLCRCHTPLTRFSVPLLPNTQNRAECLFSLLKPYLRMFRGISKSNPPGYVGFFQFLRNSRYQNAFEQAEMLLQAALDPSVASKARKGDFVTCLDHFDLLGRYAACLNRSRLGSA
jgi:hypothetical protein